MSCTAEEGSSIASPAPSGNIAGARMKLELRACSKPVSVEVVNAQLQGASCSGELDGRRPWWNEDRVPVVGSAQPKWRAISAAYPYRYYGWNRGKPAGCEAVVSTLGCKCKKDFVLDESGVSHTQVIDHIVMSCENTRAAWQLFFTART